MPWYSLGNILAGGCIVPIFIKVDWGGSVWEWAFYIGLGILYSIGWACVQVSHMSLVPSLTLDRTHRVLSHSLRTG